MIPVTASSGLHKGDEVWVEDGASRIRCVVTSEPVHRFDGGMSFSAGLWDIADINLLYAG